MPDPVSLVNLTDIPMLWNIYNGVIVQKKNLGVEKWIKAKIRQIVAMYAREDWRNSPEFSGYVELHDRYSGKLGIPSSSENIVDFILKKGSVPHINTFVDIYNVVSALTGISVGAHDTCKIVKGARLEFIPQDVPFRMIGRSGEDVARKGEYGYVDGEGIICRLDIKQSQRTKITEKTSDILVIFQGHYHMGEEQLGEGLQLFEEAVQTLLIRQPDNV